MVVVQFGSFFWGFQQGYDGTIEEGDIFLTNDPYTCDGAISHLNDWLMMMPIYIDGRIVAWAAMFGHMTDIGGKVPGSLPTDAAQIFEEGIQITVCTPQPFTLPADSVGTVAGRGKLVLDHPGVGIHPIDSA